MTSEALFHMGVGIMIAAAIIAVIACIIAHVSKKKLKEQLMKEYGPKRR